MSEAIQQLSFVPTTDKTGENLVPLPASREGVGRFEQLMSAPSANVDQSSLVDLLKMLEIPENSSMEQIMQSLQNMDFSRVGTSPEHVAQMLTKFGMMQTQVYTWAQRTAFATSVGGAIQSGARQLVNQTG